MSSKRALLFSLIPILCMAPALSQTPLWNGVLAPSRAVNWSNAGIPGGIPDGSWAKCGATIAPYGSAAAPATTAAINTQIAGCGANTYVLLGSGTFYLTGAILLKNQVVVRGMGGNSTFLVFTAMGNCNGFYSQFCLAGSNSYLGGEQGYAKWTAGFAQGTNTITLSNSLNITAGSTIVNLDQQDEANDTGNIWNCLAGNCSSAAFSGGFARTDNTCASTVSPNVGYCSQEQNALVTACSPSCNNAGSTVVTISPALYMNNWRLSQSPGAYWAISTGYRMGVEDLSADLTTTTGGTSTIVINNCYQCWISGVRSIDAARNHFWVYQSSHTIVQESYVYQSTSHGAESYGIEIANGSDNLVLANICQQVTDSCPSNTGGGAGNISAYNLGIDDFWGSSGWMQANEYDHASGTSYWLREGNSSVGFISDMVHGTHHFTTLFRNYLRGWQGGALCGGSACNSETIPVHAMAGSRYFNVVGNVLGQAGYHNTYQCVNQGPNGQFSIFTLGELGNNCSNVGDTAAYCQNPTAAGCGPTGNNDVMTVSSIMRWGNYDTVTGAVRWCGNSSSPNWSSTCASTSEVPYALQDTTATASTASLYANPVPTTTTLPNSFFLTGAAATTATIPCGSGLSFNRNPTRASCEPFPYYGPDVSNGDLGTCASGAYLGSVCRVGSNQCGAGIACTQAMAGHANLNPAHSCFLDVMGGPPDGSGSVLPFNRTSCYANDPLTLPAPPNSVVNN